MTEIKKLNQFKLLPFSSVSKEVGSFNGKLEKQKPLGSDVERSDTVQTLGGIKIKFVLL